MKIFKGIGALLCAASMGGSVIAQGLSSSMGGITTVVNDGPMDAIRNPALLVREKKTAGIGLSLMYRPYVSQSLSADMDVQSPWLSFEDKELSFVDPELFMALGGCAAYYKTDRHSVAFSFSQSRESESGGSLIRYDVSPAFTTIRFFSDKESTTWKSEGFVSYGFRVGDGFSVGIMFQLQRKVEKSGETIKSYFDTTYVTFENRGRTSFIHSSTVKAGALYVAGRFQAGLIASAGEYSFMLTDYRDIKIDYSGSDSYYISDTTSLTRAYSAGPGGLAGISYDLTGAITIAAEAGGVFPVTYSRSMLSPSTAGYFKFEEETENCGGFFFAAGMKYTVDHSLALAWGAHGMFFSFKTNGETNTSKDVSNMSISYFSFRFGIEKRIVTNGYIALFTAAECTSIEVNSHQAHGGGLEMRFSLAQARTYILGGLSYIHYY